MATPRSIPVSHAGWVCAAKHNVSWGVVRAWHSYGAFDNNAIPSLEAGNAAGIQTLDVYLFPCPSKSGPDQVCTHNHKHTKTHPPTTPLHATGLATRWPL